MQLKIVLRLLVIAACAVCVGCKTGDYLKLPACDEVIALMPEREADLLTNGRPKVISYFINAVSLQQMIANEMDIDLLKRQINKNPEFDFLIYVGGNSDDTKALEDFVYNNKLNVLLFLDTEENFKRLNLMPGITRIGIITDPELRKYDIAVCGTPLSPFDQVISEVRKGWGW